MSRFPPDEIQYSIPPSLPRPILPLRQSRTGSKPQQSHPAPKPIPRPPPVPPPKHSHQPENPGQQQSQPQPKPFDPTFRDNLPTIEPPSHIDNPNQHPTLKWTNPHITPLNYLRYIDAPPIRSGVDPFLAALTHKKLINIPRYPPAFFTQELPLDSEFHKTQLYAFLTEKVEPRARTAAWRARFLCALFPVGTGEEGEEEHGPDMRAIKEWLKRDLGLLPEKARKRVMCGMAFNGGGVGAGVG